MTRVILMAAIVAGVSSANGQLYGPNRAQTINNIFQIPIQTLSAVNNAVQQTRPIGDVVTQRIQRVQQLQNTWQQLLQNQNQPSSNSNSGYASSSQQLSASSYPSYNSAYVVQQLSFRGGRQYPSRASQVAGVSIAPDGSGFRI